MNSSTFCSASRKSANLFARATIKVTLLRSPYNWGLAEKRRSVIGTSCCHAKVLAPDPRAGPCDCHRHKVRTPQGHQNTCTAVKPKLPKYSRMCQVLPLPLPFIIAAKCKNALAEVKVQCSLCAVESRSINHRCICKPNEIDMAAAMFPENVFTKSFSKFLLPELEMG